MIGKSVSHYKILEKLGEGGMGVVYKAEDTKLKRTVALKFLPPALTKDPQAKARFVQEAQAAAALDHPHICAVHEIGEAEGTTYIVMPYVKGQSLKEKIAAGPLSVEEALDIAGQVAEGLKEAHERGIVHRDIKPANIMLTEKGQAKIMDFGLAKLTASVEVTQTLGIMGTIAYMSPEQARGEAVDHRTDIWSFGATMYEILTGQLPFGPKPEQTLIFSILNDAPEPPSRLQKGIPRPVEQLVLKTLEKDKLRRYQNMAELLKDLKAARVSGVNMPKAEKSIIVLPFENISPDPDQEYFCDGMTEEIITDLSHVHDLLVISRSSAMTFKGTKKTIPEIAGAVNVRYVLEGSVRKSGNSLRITAQLIDAKSDAHLWAEKYSGTLDDVFDLQERLSRRIVDALKVTLTTDEERLLASRPIPDFLAYDAWLRAKKEVWAFTKDAFDRAYELINHALEIVGENALLYAALGWFHALSYDFGISHDQETLLRGDHYAGRALELNPALGEAHYALSYVRYKQGDFVAAVREARRAVEQDRPAEALWMLGFVLAEIGRMAEARRFADEAVAADPLNAFSGFARVAVDFFDGRFAEAATRFRDVLVKVSPGEPVLLWWLAQSLAFGVQEDEAKRTFEQVVKMEAVPISDLSALFCQALGGNRRRVQEMLATNTRLQEAAKTDEWFPNYIAACLAQVGDYEGALEWLARAIAWGFSNHNFLGEHNRFLAPLRDDPRFLALMERAREKERRFEA